MGLSLVTAPADTPVSLDQAKAQLRVDGTDSDALIIGLVQAAVQSLDGRAGLLGRALMPQTWDLMLPCFDGDAVSLPLPPLQSVTHVKYYDTANALQTWDAANYHVVAVDEPGWLTPAYGVVWPQTYIRPDAVQVRFVAGYTDADAVPTPIRQAVLGIVTELYESRGEAQDKNVVPPAWVERLLAPYRIFGLGG